MNYYNRPLDHISLSVPNLEEAVKFYTEVMGFKETGRFKGGMEFVFISDGSTSYELIERPSNAKTTFDHIAYCSNDINADYEHFSKLGITTTEIGFIDYMFDNGVYYFFIKGACEDKIEFCQKK